MKRKQCTASMTQNLPWTRFVKTFQLPNINCEISLVCIILYKRDMNFHVINFLFKLYFKTKYKREKEILTLTVFNI